MRPHTLEAINPFYKKISSSSFKNVNCNIVDCCLIIHRLSWLRHKSTSLSLYTSAWVGHNATFLFRVASITRFKHYDGFVMHTLLSRPPNTYYCVLCNLLCEILICFRVWLPLYLPATFLVNHPHICSYLCRIVRVECQ